MSESGRYCAECGKRVELKGPTRRRDECPACAAELHSCMNCQYYDADRYRGCREPNAVAEESVRDVRRSNLCQWFDHRQGPPTVKGPPGADEAKAAFDTLFGGKKSADPAREAAEDAFAKLFKR